MGSRTIVRLGLSEETTNRLCSRGLRTAEDVLFHNDLELMHLLDVPYSKVKEARLEVSKAICPLGCTVMEIHEASSSSARLPTQLPSLDYALGGGLPCGCISELVGPAGVGKTQFCLMLSLMAALPTAHGGLDGRVVLFDTEKKFNAQRLASIASCRLPHLFGTKMDRLHLVERVIVVRPSSPQNLLDRLKALPAVMYRDGVRLIVLDSVAALLRTDLGSMSQSQRHQFLGQLTVQLKELAEGYAVPVVVTNQVLSGDSDQQQNRGRDNPMHPWHQPPPSSDLGALLPSLSSFPHPGPSSSSLALLPTSLSSFPHPVRPQGFLAPGDTRWVAALGVKWAHSVNVRLALSTSPLRPGLRTAHIAKAPMAPQMFCHYLVSLKGLEEVTMEEEDGQGGNVHQGY